MVTKKTSKEIKSCDKNKYKGKARNKRGRPFVEIDWNQFDKLAQMQCTQVEIAGFFGCTQKTLAEAVRREKGKPYLEYYEEKSQAGKIALRREQYRLALAGDKTMLIWLGKQILGQKDSMHHDINPDGIEVVINHTVKHAKETDPSD